MLGVDAIPGSDGRCGPFDGPQCADCHDYTPPEKQPVAQEFVSIESCLEKYTHTENLSEKVVLPCHAPSRFNSKAL
jgi:hypothetical protein